MNKLTKQIIGGIVGALIFAVMGLYYFSIFGANSCNIAYVGNETTLTQVGSCNCFCCHMFNNQGYESCGILGFLLGTVFCAILGVILMSLNWNKILNKK